MRIAFSVAMFANVLDAQMQSARLPIREFRLSASPVVAIGSDADPRTEFFRVDRAWRMSNGVIAVVNGGTNEIRLFDARGKYRNSFGRKGDGPGEFQNIGWSGAFGDTAFVYDGNLRRITSVLLGDTPRLLGTTPIRVTGDREFNVVGRVANGRWLVRSLGAPDVNARGLQRLVGSTGLINANATGAAQWLGDSPDLPVFIYAPASSAKMLSVIEPAFPPGLVMAASGSAIWQGDGAANAILRIDVATGARTIVKIPDVPVLLNKEMIDAARARELESDRDQASRDQTNFKYSTSVLPKYLPAFQALVAGPSGEMWVQLGAANRSQAAQYVILSSNGAITARVSAASGFRVTDIGRDYVVGIHRDADGVETIRQYALTR